MTGLHAKDARYLGGQLLALRASEPRDPLALGAWYAEAQKVTALLSDPELTVEDIPHELWHYLSDADIRMKDSRYEGIQTPKIDAFIASLLRAGCGAAASGDSG